MPDVAIPFAVIGGLLLVLRGCPGPDRPLDPAAVAQVRQGMSEREVLDLLGPPAEPFDLTAVSQALGVAGSGYRWRDRRRKLEMYLIDGRVAGTVAVGYERHAEPGAAADGAAR